MAFFSGGLYLEKKFYSGFVSIIGQTNAGKSTLMNKIIGQKISIVSNKPQTTRNRILSVITDIESQIIFLDTPGVHTAKTKLSEFMLKSVEKSLRETDLILFLIEPKKIDSEINKKICERLKKIQTPVILVINKIDILENKKQKIIELASIYREFDFSNFIAVSALTGEGLDKLLNLIKRKLPVGPKYFDDEFLTDMPERDIICEIVREKILLSLKDEIPHGCAVKINLFKKRDNKNLFDIEANIFCEKESHKKIIIGKDGSMLKKIGTQARLESENLLGIKINLKLWVKTKKNWRNNNFYLKEFGYSDKKN